MNEHDVERLSALADGELARAHEVRMVQAMLADEDLRETWRRYQLIGAAIRGEAHAGAGLAERVRTALADEPVALAPRRARFSGVPRRVGVAASLAASLAIVVLAGVWVMQDRPTGDERVVAAAAGPSLATPVAAEQAPVHASAAAVPARALPGVPVVTAVELPAPRELPARGGAPAVSLAVAAGGASPVLGRGATAIEGARRASWNGGLRPIDSRRLSDYLVSHTAERGTMTGMHPYARIVVDRASFR